MKLLFAVLIKTFLQALHYCNTYTATAGKNTRFILLEKSDLHVVDDLSIAVHILLMRILTLLSVDVILLPGWITRSTNFKGLTFSEELVPSWLKHELYRIWVHEVHASCCYMLWNRNSAWTGVLARSARSSALPASEMVFLGYRLPSFLVRNHFLLVLLRFIEYNFGRKSYTRSFKQYIVENGISLFE